MKKYIIHSEPITKPFEKFPFQVKVPQDARSLTGIHVSVDYPFSPTNEDFAQDAQTGDLWLSVPNAPEHFFTQLVRLTDIASNRLQQINAPGISLLSNQWIKKKELNSMFSITIDKDSEIIEGFYESSVTWNHMLKIYLEFDE